MTVKRATRVSERLKDELARAVRDLSDPRVEGAIVSRVEMTDDLSIARVHVRRAVGAPDARAQKALIAGFAAASRRLRAEVGRAVGLRYTPELRFFYDAAPDDVDRIEELLRQVERDR
ncbi:MAG TPA: 30S ribosome-binding factor RbfA, partial [Byssovorax sp.]